MKCYERFLNYVQINTRSDPSTGMTPSSDCQWDLANLLKKECEDCGLADVRLSEYGYVYATIPSNIKENVPVVGLIAHMDTTPEISGKNVKPRIIKNYDGKDIALNDTVVLSVKDHPLMNRYIGHDLIVTDGTTCLGADDKAGIAEIMTIAQTLIEHPEIKHGTIKIAFTPDEEIGEGADHFDLSFFNADFAYTLDGGDPCCFNYETFNASSALVTIKGISIHPGSAKGKMINSINVAHQFHEMLDPTQRPEHTEGFEGFNHLYKISGDIEQTTMHYIIRNHDEKKFNAQITQFIKIRDYLNELYGQQLVSCEIKEQYKNMKSGFDKKMYIVSLAEKAIRSIGLEPVSEAVRGGTDGARLTFMGLPCPNLGTGGANCHGRYEFCSIDQMSQMVQIGLNLIAQVRELKL